MTENPTPEIQTPTQWVTKQQIAQHLRCSQRHVNNLMTSRVLPHTKIGRFVRFDLTACDMAMRQYQTKSLFS